VTPGRQPGPILVVEDDPGARAALASLLNFVGYTTITTRGAEEALALLRSGPRPSLVILDILLAGMDGIAFRQALLADPGLARLPVIVHSAHATVVPQVLAHVPKGSDPELLLALVAKALAAAKRAGSGGGSPAS
jgi:CheY-like chemotaxis protein